MTPRPANLFEDALRTARRPLIYAFLFSAVSNILFLAFPIFTTLVYGRIFMSQNIASLVALTLGVVACFVIVMVLDNLRSKILIHFGVLFDRMLSRHVFAALFTKNLAGTGQSQALRDLDQFRQSMTGHGVGALFDLPWAPIFLIVLFVIDPYIGLLTLVGGLILFGLAIAQERASTNALKDVNDAALRSYQFTDMALRNAEAVRALGMLPAIGARWQVDRSQLIAGQANASHRAGAIGDVIKFVTMIIQTLVMALGAYLAIKAVISPAVLFASTILSAKALAPLQRIVASWQELGYARQSYGRLMALLDGYEPVGSVTALPTPAGAVSVENVTFQPDGVAEPTLKNVSFAIAPGEALGIVGPSGAGKSTLSRLLVGIWRPTDGHVRLDGADVHAWDRAAFGRHVGYLPQDTELFTGTVRDNIARFRSDVSDAAVIKAAQEAGVHELIVRLPKGYDTPLGPFGTVLSVGQRQRLGLARALLGDPSLVVLDEPNANLDADGETALLQAMTLLKQRRATVIIVSHRASVFRHVDKMLVIRDGRVVNFGLRDVIMASLMQAAQPAQAPAPPPQPQAPEPPAQPQIAEKGP